MTRPTLTPIALAPLRKKVASLLGVRESRVKSEMSPEADPNVGFFVDMASVDGDQVVKLHELAIKLKFSVRIQPSTQHDRAAEIRVEIFGKIQMCIYSESTDLSL